MHFIERKSKRQVKEQYNNGNNNNTERERKQNIEKMFCRQEKTSAWNAMELNHSSMTNRHQRRRRCCCRRD